jgi:glyceraldehyde 3-phosphate dehydrogenase
MKIAINGLGRIGRCLLRALAKDAVWGPRLVAVNGPGTPERVLPLIRYDSIYGRADPSPTVEAGVFRMGSVASLWCSERDPLALPWKDLGVDVVLECSGRFNDREAAAQHVTSGARHVIVSAPCDRADATIIYGVNHGTLRPDHRVISAASCTTNALAPLVAWIDNQAGWVRGHATTVHAYTNDQNLVDGSHRDPRRARAAALSMIPTSTGAAKAIDGVLPHLAGTIKASAVRVPVANVSMIDLTCEVRNTFNSESWRAMLGAVVKSFPLNAVVGVTDDPVVSIDGLGLEWSSWIDRQECRMLDHHWGRVVAWYDNEWAFATRMLDILRHLDSLDGRGM